MPDKKFPLEFKKCPVCGCPDTVARLACEPLKEARKIPKEAFASFRKEVTPLADPRGVALYVEVIVAHWDICARCGLGYYTRAEITNAPVQIQGQRQFGFPQNDPRRS